MHLSNNLRTFVNSSNNIDRKLSKQDSDNVVKPHTAFVILEVHENVKYTATYSNLGGV